jgi:hypothetical protein
MPWTPSSARSAPTTQAASTRPGVNGPEIAAAGATSATETGEGADDEGAVVAEP